MEVQLEQFPMQSLQLIEKLKQTGEEITLTENGLAIAKVIPISQQSLSSFIGSMEGSVIVNSDITEPINEAWNVCET